MFHLDLGSIPEWLAGLALPLAFIQIGKQIQDQRRAQVDKVGAWCNGTKTQGNPPEWAFTVTVSLHNGSELPVTVSDIAIALNLTGSPLDGSSESLSRRLRRPEELVIPPQSDKEIPVDGRFEEKGYSKLTLQAARITDMIVLDNAGRQWYVRPQKPYRPMLKSTWYGKLIYRFGSKFRHVGGKSGNGPPYGMDKIKR